MKLRDLGFRKTAGRLLLLSVKEKYRALFSAHPGIESADCLLVSGLIRREEGLGLKVLAFGKKKEDGVEIIEKLDEPLDLPVRDFLGEEAEPLAEKEEEFRELLNACRERRFRGKPLLTAMKLMKGDINAELPFPAELLPEWDPQKRAAREVLIEACYDGYLQREEKEIARRENLENLEIPADFDYDLLPGLCNEARQKLLKLRPVTLGQASRIDGVTPIDVALIQVALKRGENK